MQRLSDHLADVVDEERARRPCLRPWARLPLATVMFLDGAVATVEVAWSDRDHRRGLMYRARLPPNVGMLFIFEDLEDRAFWMRDVLIPLDVIFLDGTRIVGIQANVPAGREESFRAGQPSNRVIELNAGWTRAHGVRVGQKVVIAGA